MGKINDYKHNRKSNTPTVTSDIEKGLRSPGRPLDKKTQVIMESRFGHDFSRVRIHTDQKAAESAEESKVAAYTVGHEIVFGKGQYAPDSMRGRAILAHELTHVVQQQSAFPMSSKSLEKMTPRDDPSEREADRVAKVVATAGQTYLLEEQLIGMREGEAPVPGYLYSLISSSKKNQNLYQPFKPEFDDDLLDMYWRELGEPQRVVNEIGQITPLQRVRVAGCARESSEKEQLSRDLPGNDEMVREILTFFYPSLTPPTEINDQLRQLAAVMLAQAIEGSRAMDYIPRPPSRPSPTWLFTEAVKIAWRRGRDEGIYVPIRNEVARSHRSEYELARMGI